MDKFQIESAQNINIQQNVASVLSRILAFLIDFFVIIAYVIAMSIMLNAVELDLEEMWVIYLTIGLPILLYHLLFETLMNGQSLGKAALKIRVVKRDGTKPEFSNFLIRWLFRLVDISMTSGSLAVVTILLNGKGQRIGDMATGTTVISEKPTISLKEMFLFDLPENYQPKYPQVRILSDKEIQTIKKIFLEAKSRSNHQIIITLSRKTAQIMQVEPDEKPMTFLKTIISDYHYYTQN